MFHSILMYSSKIICELLVADFVEATHGCPLAFGAAPFIVLSTVFEAFVSQLLISITTATCSTPCGAATC